MGVQSSILPIFMPALARALRADWAPGPGVFVRFPPGGGGLEGGLEGWRGVRGRVGGRGVRGVEGGPN